MSHKESFASQEAARLFEKAQAQTKNGRFDEAIELFIKGLRLEPEAVTAHAALRSLALNRRESGGDHPTEFDVRTHGNGKTPLDQMLNAEYLFAKQPDHLPYAERLLRSAVAGGYKKTAQWIADMLFVANHRCKRPSVPAYLFLKEMYVSIAAYDRAVKACQEALKLNPNDHALIEALSDLQQKADESKVDQQKVTPDTNAHKEAQAHRDAAQLFFSKAQNAAEQGNYDYAIDLYMDGLRRDPEALEQGHLALARLGLKRHAEGGKKPSMVERAKHLYSKTPLDQMLSAEYLFTKDPTNTDYAESMLKAAVGGEFNQTAGWIANLLFQTNNALEKPSFHTYIILKDAYQALGQLDKAVAACQWALKLRPDKDELAEEFKNLTAELTMATGKYGQEGSFRDSLKDARRQEHLYAQNRVVKTENWRLLAVDEARKAFTANPNLPENIYTLASALSDLENEAADTEALQILETAYHQQQNFSFKEKAGQLHLKHLKRRLNQAKTRLQANPEAQEGQAEVKRLKNELVNSELEHYQLCVENYPTNRRYAYEYAVRLTRLERYDEAIPLFQEARKDPARRILSMNQIGLCFFQKNWLADAIDVFSQAIDDYEMKDDALGKELRYNLGRAYEAKGDAAKALEIYRRIAQADFAYKDISERVSRLRAN